MRQPPENSATGRRCAGLAEAQPREQGLGAGARLVAADLVVARVQLGHALAAFVRRLGRRDRLLEAAQLAVAVDHELEGRALERGGLLRHVGEHPARRHVHGARVRMQLAADQREQARLAAAVGSHEAHLVPRMHVHRRILEDDPGSPAQRDAADP